MSREVLALRVSNHKLMRVFNRDWKRKAMQLEESKAGLQQEVSEQRKQVKKLQIQALASDAAAQMACQEASDAGRKVEWLTEQLKAQLKAKRSGAKRQAPQQLV
jgi:hypothetical protein